MMNSQVAQNWSALTAGQSVVITESSALQYSGTVDELTEDKTVLWIIAGTSRRAFDYREGVVVVPAEPEQPPTKPYLYRALRQA
ncbi:hypothetical protein PV772_11175 [Pseudarthrobacter sp. CC12]